VLAAVPFPGFEPHPEVWLLVGLLGTAYAIAAARVGPRLAPPHTPVVTRLQAVCFGAGLLALLVASDWPLHDLGENYLFSVHMVQHLVYSIVAAPLLLLGTPTWMARAVLSPPWLLRTVRWWARFLPATILFNAVVIFTHVPFVVDAAVHNGFVHFLVHALVFTSALIVWMPLASPLPEVPRFQPILRMLFLFLQAIVPTIPASFLTFGADPLYPVYAGFPRIWGMDALTDQLIAGLIMKIVGGLILWSVIAAIFFRWGRREERDGWDELRYTSVEREIRTGITR
jgi:putative membrane protein